MIWIALFVLVLAVASYLILRHETRPVQKFRCEVVCEDRICRLYGCPDSPEWIGDMK